MSEFKAFSKIENIGKLFMSITQKIHGSNAQVLIYSDENGVLQLRAGSRTRWLAPGDDNYNFAQFVCANKEEFIEKLGEGRHYGEWAGPGINAGEGLKEKTFVLFNWWYFKDKIDLPKNVAVVPVLYSGKFSMENISQVMEELKTNGSKLVPGYMKPEGIVIQVAGTFYKKVFEDEEIAWKGKDENKEKKIYFNVDVSYLLQPIRLEKLLSRDERYIADYPVSLPIICKDYVQDLESEGHIVGLEEEISAIKKALGKQVFKFVKEFVNNGCAAKF